MSSCLSALHPELQLIIAADLGPDLTGLRDDDIYPPYDDNVQYRSSRDLQVRDREWESIRNLINWSCVSKYFRSLLAPLVFRTIILRNKAESATSVETIAARSEYVHYVKELQFVGWAPGDAKRHDAAFRDTRNILPWQVRELLADLKRFPNLRSLSVEFDYDFDDCEEWEEEGVNTIGEGEDMEEIRQGERNQAWRNLMVKVWKAVSQNQAGVIEKLTINRLYYKESSAFTDPAFHRFLGSLEHFSISIWAGDNGAGWRTNTCQSWVDFVARLDEFFFNHLRNLTSLTVKASNMAPIGFQGIHHAPLRLRKEHMPMLKSLHLEYMFLSPELRGFLVAKAPSLQKVHLRSCLAEGEVGMVAEVLCWHELFDAISSAKPKNLREFRLSEEEPAPLPENIPRDFEKSNSKFANEDMDALKEEIAAARETVKGGGKRVWAHVTVDDKYGMLFEDIEENFVSFREGRDQKAYERLCNIISRNGAVDVKVDRKQDP